MEGGPRLERPLIGSQDVYKLAEDRSGDHRFYGVVNLTLIAFLFALVFVLLATDAASAHFNEYGDSVRKRRIDYRDAQPYDGARLQAVKSWNNSEVKGKVKILPYRGSGNMELYIYDVYQENGYAGYWFGGPNVQFPHKIRLNRYWFSRYNYRQKSATITHELGHSLRLDHPPSTAYSKTHSIMYYCPACTRLGGPQRHDRRDYNRVWRVS